MIDSDCHLLDQQVLNLAEAVAREEIPVDTASHYCRELARITSNDAIARCRHQLALAWILAQGKGIVPIPGTRSAQRVQENVGGADLGLTGADLDQIAEILPSGGFGARYANAMLPKWD